MRDDTVMCVIDKLAETSLSLEEIQSNKAGLDEYVTISLNYTYYDLVEPLRLS